MISTILFIDNFDSFTFNLVEAFERLGCDIRVLRNRVAAPAAFALARGQADLIVLSPGPGTPRDAGCCLELIGLAKGHVPLLGICLGHQAIVEQAGRRRRPRARAGPRQGLAAGARRRRADARARRFAQRRPLPFAVHPPAAGAVPDPCRDRRHGDGDQRRRGAADRPAIPSESILTLHGDRILRNVLEDAREARAVIPPDRAAMGGGPPQGGGG
jgi:anthranilate/para-aminobenzoate synthase component II